MPSILDIYIYNPIDKRLLVTTPPPFRLQDSGLISARLRRGPYGLAELSGPEPVGACGLGSMRVRFRGLESYRGLDNYQNRFDLCLKWPTP